MTAINYKTCKDCKECKPLTSFPFRKAVGKYVGSSCQICFNERIRVQAAERKLKDPERIKAQRQAQRIKHLAKIKADNKRWREKNKDVVREKSKKWRDENKAYIRAYRSKKSKAEGSVKRSETIKQRSICKSPEISEWIASFHSLAHYLELLDGCKYEVDHIVPLHHKDVCGLHVPWNLSVIPRTKNLKKSNKFDGSYYNLGWQESIKESCD